MSPTLNKTIRRELHNLLEQKNQCSEKTSVTIKDFTTDEGNPESMKSGMHLFEGCNDPLPLPGPALTGPRAFGSIDSCTDPNYPAPPYGAYNCGLSYWQMQLGFYNHVGSPNPGEVVHINHQACYGTTTFCLRYVGQGQTATFQTLQTANVLGVEPSCKECEDPGSGTDIPGCLDQSALNYNECCDNDPNCTPTENNKECCRYERVNEDKGCIDPNATNNGVCCNGDPACTVVGSNPECCEYESEPCPPQECGQNQYWDTTQCKCVCETWLNCKKPLVFNPQTCKCEKKSPGPSNDFPIDLAEEIKRYKELL